MTAVIIFDTDGANPYGREVASLLRESGFDVEAIMPQDVEWVPPGLRVQKIQPLNRPDRFWKQCGRQLNALFRTAYGALVERRILLVIMTRGWSDQLGLLLLGWLGARIIIVAHDPIPKSSLSAAGAIIRRAFWRSARVLIVHSNKLQSEAETFAGRPALVVPHVPFVHYAVWAAHIAPDVPSQGTTRLLVLGQMRPDKGLGRLPAILEHMPLPEREGYSIGFAGRGAIDDVVCQTRALMRVVRTPSRTRLSDGEIAQALAEADILLAPYAQVSASGSVVLALSRNIRVLAYDAGAISQVLAADGLVAAGAEKDFAEAILQSRTERGANPIEPLAAWRTRSLDAWVSAVRLAAKR